MVSSSFSSTYQTLRIGGPLAIREKKIEDVICYGCSLNIKYERMSLCRENYVGLFETLPRVRFPLHFIIYSRDYGVARSSRLILFTITTIYIE